MFKRRAVVTKSVSRSPSGQSRPLATVLLLTLPLLATLQGCAKIESNDWALPYAGQCESIIATWTETRDATLSELETSEYLAILLKNTNFPEVDTTHLTESEAAYLDEISAAWWEAYLLIQDRDSSNKLSMEQATLIAQGDIRLKEECSSESRPVEEPVVIVEPLGGYCSTVQRQIGDAYDIMLGGGITFTEGEVIFTLKESGDMLTQGYDLSMIENQDDLTLVRNAGFDLLKIRSSLLSGQDASADVKTFVSRYNKLNRICSR